MGASVVTETENFLEKESNLNLHHLPRFFYYAVYLSITYCVPSHASVSQ